MIEALFERWPEIAVAVASVAVVAVIGGVSTDVGPWYKRLNFPRLKPPDWAFGPGWTVIFAFIAASGVVAWDAASAKQRSLIAALFAINAVLNILWSPLFFKLRRPDWALYELVPFWLSIAALVVALSWVSTAAGLLILPYLAWVTYAGWLNWRVVALNPPFATREAAAGKSDRNGRIS
jgi:tryptophan-rich sensory protein